MIQTLSPEERALAYEALRFLRNNQHLLTPALQVYREKFTVEAARAQKAADDGYTDGLIADFGPIAALFRENAAATTRVESEMADILARDPR